MLRRGLQTIVLIGVACAIGFSHAQLPIQPKTSESAGYLPGPEVARLASLGFDALVADFYWFQAVQIAGGPQGPVGQSHRIGALVDLVTELDPWVDHPYRFAALWMTDDVAAIRMANELLWRGIEHHPDEWRNRFYLAFNHYFYLGEHAEAAEVLEPAIGMPKAPRYLGRLVARLKGQDQGLDVPAAFLRELIARAPDGYARAHYERALDEIETERRARVLDRAREAFRERHGRDIEDVAELVSVAPPILRKLPEEPHGADWKIDDRGVIVSSKLRYRYRPKIDASNREIIQSIHEKGTGEEEEEGGS